MTLNDKQLLLKLSQNFNVIENEKDKKYYQNIIILDTETTTVFSPIINQKVAFAYKFLFMIDDVYYQFDTPQAFVGVLQLLKQHTSYAENERKYKIWVHNLGYDFIFLRNFLKRDNKFLDCEVFSRRPNDYCKILIDNTFEFCDTLALKNCSLATWGKELKIPKMIGDLDYSKIRTYSTPLTDEEKQYNLHDVKIINAGIKQFLKRYGVLKNIPMTSTGIVRKALKDYLNSIKIQGKTKVYTPFAIMRNEYNKSRPNAQLLLSLKLAYTGGITHCSVLENGLVLNNVGGFDISSSYPYQMCTRKFPHKFDKLENKSQLQMLELFKDINNCACLSKVTFFNLRPKANKKPLSIIAGYTAIELENNRYNNNGKIIHADKCTIFITNIDYINICRFYDFDNIEFDINYYWCSRGKDYKYLNKYFVDFILSAYADKTQLKGIESEADRYLLSKQIVNGLYGMCVQFPLNDVIEYHIENTEEPFKTKPIVEKMHTQIHNADKKELFEILQNAEIVEELDNILDEIASPKHQQYLLYQTGVWCTAYARFQLCTMIEKIHSDFFYSDTDSIKCHYTEKVKKAFTEENEKITKRIEKLAEHLHRDFNDFAPKDIKGNAHLMGLWDFEYCANEFKTLGAKRYLYTYFETKTINNRLYRIKKYKSVVAGCNPDNMIHFLKMKHNYNSKKIFNDFSHNLIVPANHTGKKTHKTILLNDNYKIPVTDYQGNTENVVIGSFILLEPCVFTMKLFMEYIEAINKLNAGCFTWNN